MSGKNEGAMKEKQSKAMQKKIKKLKKAPLQLVYRRKVSTDLDFAPEHLFIMKKEKALKEGNEKTIDLKWKCENDTSNDLLVIKVRDMCHDHLIMDCQYKVTCEVGICRYDEDT